MFGLCNDPSNCLFTMLFPPICRSSVKSDSSMQESIYVGRFLFQFGGFQVAGICYYNASLMFGVLHPNVTDISQNLFPCTAKNA